MITAHLLYFIRIHIYTDNDNSACTCYIFYIPVYVFTQTQSDRRLKQSGELLHNIKLIKLYAWEALFTENIVKTRNKELKMLLKVALFRVLSCTSHGLHYFAHSEVYHTVRFIVPRHGEAIGET